MTPRRTGEHMQTYENNTCWYRMGVRICAETASAYDNADRLLSTHLITQGMPYE